MDGSTRLASVTDRHPYLRFCRPHRRPTHRRHAATGSTTAFITSDTTNTAQTITTATTGNGTTPVTVTTRRTDPYGLTRAPTFQASGNTPLATAPASATGPGSNPANPGAFSAATGYLTGLADAATALTHQGARDLDPVLGSFTAPDPVLKLDEAKNFSPYVYGEANAINNTDPSGLIVLGPALDDGGSWHGKDADVSPGQWHLSTSPGQADNYDARDIAGLAPVFQATPAPVGPSASDKTPPTSP